MQLIQVTLLAGATPIIAPSATQTPTQKMIPFQVLMLQNNGANVCRVGDASVAADRGIVLAPGSTTPQPPLVIKPGLEYSSDLSEYFLFGTADDVIDVMYLA